MSLRPYPRRFDLVVDVEEEGAVPRATFHFNHEALVQCELPNIDEVLMAAESVISIIRQRNGEIPMTRGMELAEKVKEDVCVLLNGKNVKSTAEETET